MSTRASIILKDETDTLFFYRHSDGYPDCTGADLKEFVSDYKSGALRRSVDQSAGWLIVRGHFEYKSAEPAGLNSKGEQLFPSKPDRAGPRPNSKNKYNGWKVGAYEPACGMHGDEEYIYIIDLNKMELSCRQPKEGYWDKPSLKNTVPCKEFKTVKIGGVNE